MSLLKKWYIYYRFYDPVHNAKFPQGKLRIIKGMNEFQTLAERQQATEALIEVELNELKNLGFGDFARYTIGTNSNTSHWSGCRKGEKPIDRKQVYEHFEKNWIRNNSGC